MTAFGFTANMAPGASGRRRAGGTGAAGLYKRRGDAAGRGEGGARAGPGPAPFSTSASALYAE